MFEFSLAELAIIVVVVFLFVKPEDIPELMRGLGKIIAKIKDIASEIKESFSEVIHETKEPLEKILDLDGVEREVYDVKILDEFKEKKPKDE